MTETLSWHQTPIPVPPLYSGSQHLHLSPGEVLADTELSAAEKRSILAFWASDACAVESRPWLRQPPGLTKPIAYEHVREALYQLDCIQDSRPANDNALRLNPSPRTPALIADRPAEPTLDEVLADPIVQLLMRRDGVTERDVRALGGQHLKAGSHSVVSAQNYAKSGNWGSC